MCIFWYCIYWRTLNSVTFGLGSRLSDVKRTFNVIENLRLRQLVGYCATRREVAGSIHDYITGIIHWHNPSRRIMAPRWSQPVAENSTGNISWGCRRQCEGLTTLLPSCADCLEMWELQLAGALRACPGLSCDSFTFHYSLPLKSHRFGTLAHCRNSNFKVSGALKLCPAMTFLNETLL